jgi:HPt (histidine-containing phosphotransfer) domain-containing protein
VKGCECEEPNPGFDEAALLRSVGGDIDFLAELIGLFLAACPTLLSQIRGSLASNNFAEARRSTRILRSALRSLTAESALKSIEALETALYQCQSAAATEAFRDLEKQIEGLNPAFLNLEKSHLNTDPAPGAGLWRRF